jgi:hypothetical protein
MPNRLEYSFELSEMRLILEEANRYVLQGKNDEAVVVLRILKGMLEATKISVQVTDADTPNTGVVDFKPK